MQNNILSLFLNQTYYKSQITRRLKVLKGFLENKFFNSPKHEVSPEDTAWLQSLGEDFYNSEAVSSSAYKNFTKLNVYQILAKLEKDIKELQTLTVYVPFEMPDAEKDKLGAYLRANFKKDLIFEIKLDPELIGGTALTWKGVYKDYSLRARIDQNNEAILASLNTFLI